MKKLPPAQSEVMMRLMALADAPHNLEAMQYVVFQFDFRDYDQFIIECPPGSIRFNSLLRVAIFCDNLGFLVENESIDREAIFEMFPIPWAKVEAVIQGMRRDLDWADAFDYFERLGASYVGWWEARKGSAAAGGEGAADLAPPRSLTVPRQRPPLPVRPPAPPARAAGPPRPAPQAPEAAPPPAPTPPTPTPEKPALRVRAKPPLKLGGKSVRVVPPAEGAKPVKAAKPTKDAKAKKPAAKVKASEKAKPAKRR